MEGEPLRGEGRERSAKEIEVMLPEVL